MNFPLDLPVHDRFLSVAETHIFSPRLVNEARVGYVRIDNKAINEPIVTVDDLGINRPNSNLYKTIYKFTFSTFNLGPTPGADQSQLQNNLTFLDTASYTAGKHVLRFGGQYDRVALDKNFPQTFNGELFFFRPARIRWLRPVLAWMVAATSRTSFWDSPDSLSAAAAFPITNTASTTTGVLPGRL